MLRVHTVRWSWKQFARSGRRWIPLKGRMHPLMRWMPRKCVKCSPPSHTARLTLTQRCSHSQSECFFVYECSNRMQRRYVAVEWMHAMRSRVTSVTGCFACSVHGAAASITCSELVKHLVRHPRLRLPSEIEAIVSGEFVAFVLAELGVIVLPTVPPSGALS